MLILGIVLVLFLLFSVYCLFPTRYYKNKYKRERSKKGKVLYLTFDDGPSEYTDKLLAVLKKNNVRATFFCVASFASKYPSIIEKMSHDGHVIGLHSYSHKNAYLLTPKKTNQDFQQSLLELTKLNQTIVYYRPPWGDINLWTLKNIKKRNLKLILWHVMAEDWEAKTTSEIIKRKLLERIKGGDIICLHDGRGKDKAPLKTIAALEEVLPILKKQGYKFETIDQYEK